MVSIFTTKSQQQAARIPDITRKGHIRFRVISTFLSGCCSDHTTYALSFVISAKFSGASQISLFYWREARLVDHTQRQKLRKSLMYIVFVTSPIQNSICFPYHVQTLTCHWSVFQSFQSSLRLDWSRSRESRLMAVCISSLQGLFLRYLTKTRVVHHPPSSITSNLLERLQKWRNNSCRNFGGFLADFKVSVFGLS